MNSSASLDQPLQPGVLEPAPVRSAVIRRRMSLRANGLLAIVAVIVLAVLLVLATLVFRGVVEGELAAVQQAGSRESALLHLAVARNDIDLGTVLIACLAMLGIMLIGALALLFFSRLGTDIAAVRARALAILNGDRSRGQPLARNDELGDLAQAVDSLAEALGRHEREREIERRQVTHHEKLATIGSMAAGVVRDIGNPIAAIDGYARAIADAHRAGQALPAGAEWAAAGQILNETMRLVAITREISALAATPASQRQLASLNEIVTQAVGLMRYEPRLEGAAVTTTLDPQLPAIEAVADRLVLLLVNLISNAADATADLPARSARIELATRSAAGGVELSVSDNGCGMSDAVRERAFEPLFSTKTEGRGTGLGLPLCRSIAQDHGGRISLQSEAGKGTRVIVWLPISSRGEPVHSGQ
jgi:two-component system, NtrC family, sensor kinase